jgi:acyl-CoA thioesterase-1
MKIVTVTKPTLLLLTILLMSYSPIATAKTVKQKTLLVVGDSLSAAYGLRQNTGWVDLLSMQLKATNSTWKVANASISGETTSGASERIAELLKLYQPEIVLIELGGNDGLRGFPPKVTYRNLEKIIQLSQQQKAKVIITGIHLPPNYGKKYEQLFYQNYIKLTEKYALTMVPFILEGIAGNPELMQKDGIHPKENAQQKILDNVWIYLKTLITK